jgi:hypothetical protein
LRPNTRASLTPALTPIWDDRRIGFLDDVTFGLFDPFMGPGRAQRRGNRIQESGAASRGVLRGIKVRSGGDTTDSWFFGVEVQPTGQPSFRAACRQAVGPVRSTLRLGMSLDIRHDGKAIVIAWDSTGPGGWRRARAVDDGISDSRLPKLKGDPAEAEVAGWRPLRMAGMERAERDVRLRIGGIEQDWRTIWVPEYAQHLLAPGTGWPVFLRGDRVAVDWLGAIERHGAGVGVPVPEPTDPERDERPEDRVAAFAQRMLGAAPSAANDGDPMGVSFDTWVAVSAGLVRDRVPPADYEQYAQRHGVPAGCWAEAEAQWKGRMTADWQLGARFGEAYERALKG